MNFLTNIKQDINNVFTHDPAAKSKLEVFLCYPGLHALWIYRVAHALWRKNFRLSARFISHIARFITGIEIHPGAIIGKNFFIDHGFGVVIGETAEIGDNVTIYQGVTLGGTSLTDTKRHPTLKNGVTVGAGAKILGAFTVGENAKIGSNTVVTKEVPSFATVVGIPGRCTGKMSCNNEFELYATGTDMPDPIGNSVDDIKCSIENLEKQLLSIACTLQKLNNEYHNNLTNNNKLDNKD